MDLTKSVQQGRRSCAAIYAPEYVGMGCVYDNGLDNQDDGTTTVLLAVLRSKYEPKYACRQLCTYFRSSDWPKLSSWIWILSTLIIAPVMFDRKLKETRQVDILFDKTQGYSSSSYFLLPRQENVTFSEKQKANDDYMYTHKIPTRFLFWSLLLSGHGFGCSGRQEGKWKQVRLVSAEAERPNHPSHGGVSQGGGVASQGGVSQPGRGVSQPGGSASGGGGSTTMMTTMHT